MSRTCEVDRCNAICIHPFINLTRKVFSGIPLKRQGVLGCGGNKYDLASLFPGDAHSVTLIAVHTRQRTANIVALLYVSIWLLFHFIYRGCKGGLAYVYFFKINHSIFFLTYCLRTVSYMCSYIKY